MMRSFTCVAAVIAAVLTALATIVATPLVAHAEDNNQTAFDFFVGHGLTKEQSAGIVGNLMAESGDPINPRAVQPGGPGRGIAQWSVGGGRSPSRNSQCCCVSSLTREIWPWCGRCCSPF